MKRLIILILLFTYSFCAFSSASIPDSIYVEQSIKGISIFADRKYRFIDDTFIVRNPRKDQQTVYRYHADSQFIYLEEVISEDKEIGTFDTSEILYELNEHTLYLYFPDESEIALVDQDYKNTIVKTISLATLSAGIIGGVAHKTYLKRIEEITKAATASVGLDANQTFKVADKNMEFTTDSLGRPARATGTVTLGDSERNSNVTRMVGNIENRSDVDGGHLIGDSLGGPSSPCNLVEMKSSLNRGAYAQLEKQLKNAAEQGKKVLVDIIPIYEGSKLMPSKIEYKYTIDGESFTKVFLNE